MLLIQELLALAIIFKVLLHHLIVPDKLSRHIYWGVRDILTASHHNLLAVTCSCTAQTERKSLDPRGYCHRRGLYPSVSFHCRCLPWGQGIFQQQTTSSIQWLFKWTKELEVSLAALQIPCSDLN